MKAKLTQLDVEAYEVSLENLPEILGMIIPDPAVTAWRVNSSGPVSLRLCYGDDYTQAYMGDWLVKVGGKFHALPDDLFQEIIELQPDLTLPSAVWLPSGDMMARVEVLNLPSEVGGNTVLGSYIESPELPHGVKGFRMDFFPVEDAVEEARYLAPRAAKLLGHGSLLGMQRIVPRDVEPKPGEMARFWFYLCNSYGQSIKEDK